MRNLSFAVIAALAMITPIGTAQAQPPNPVKCLTVAAYPQPPKPGMIKRFSLRRDHGLDYAFGKLC